MEMPSSHSPARPNTIPRTAAQVTLIMSDDQNHDNQFPLRLTLAQRQVVAEAFATVLSGDSGSMSRTSG